MHITIGTQRYWVRTEADLVILCLRSRLVMRITVGGCWVAVVAEYQLVEAVLEQWSSS